MPEFAAADWDALAAVARRVGYPDERVSAVRRRLGAAGDRAGGPLVLLAGRPDAGIELLLARWLKPDAADALKAAGKRPLVVGPKPADVKPALGGWPGFASSAVGPGHLLAVRSSGRLPADVHAQVGSLGFVDQVVLVTRLSQPLHTQERELVRSIAGLAAAVKVLVVAVPGEEPTDDDLAEVSALAVTQMGQNGFGGGRCLGAGVWFTGGKPRAGTIADVGAFLAADPNGARSAVNGMANEALGELFRELAPLAATNAPPPTANVDEAEQERLTRELTGFLADLGRELERKTAERAFTAETVREYAVNAVKGWGAHVGVEGHWMKYVDRLRPGSHALLVSQAEAAAPHLDYRPGVVGLLPEAAPMSPQMARLMTEAKRAGVGLLLGMVAYIAVAFALKNTPTTLPDWLVTALAVLALVVLGVIGYGVAGRFFKVPGPAADPTAAVPAAVLGWPTFDRGLAAWFREHVRSRPASPADECRRLAARFGLPETHP